MPWPVYLTLLPVIGGVGMASVGEISFSFLAFAAAMTSNISAASRSVLGKKYMASESKKVRRRGGGEERHAHEDFFFPIAFCFVIYFYIYCCIAVFTPLTFYSLGRRV